MKIQVDLGPSEGQVPLRLILGDSRTSDAKVPLDFQS